MGEARKFETILTNAVELAEMFIASDYFDDD